MAQTVVATGFNPAWEMSFKTTLHYTPNRFLSSLLNCLVKLLARSITAPKGVPKVIKGPFFDQTSAPVRLLRGPGSQLPGRDYWATYA